MLLGFLIGKNEHSRFIKKKYCNGTGGSVSASWNIYWC